MRPVVELAVGDVEVGAHPGIEPGHRGVLIGAGQGDEDRVVGGRGLQLPALRVEEQRAVGVVAEVETDVGLIEQAHVGARLGLGPRRRPAVGVAGGLLGGALLVVVPLLRVVAVDVDAVADLDHAVAVDVARVLPPQALCVEGELVAVRIDHREEPELGPLQDLANAAAVAAIVRYQRSSRSVTSVLIHSRACVVPW